MAETSFSSDIWANLYKGIVLFFEKQGIKDEIIVKSPEKIVIDFSLLSQYFLAEHGQLLMDRLDEAIIYDNFTTLIKNVAQEYHPSPEKLKYVAIKNMKMRLGITKIGDFISQSYGKMICVRAILRTITEKNPKISTIVMNCDTCGDNIRFPIKNDFFTEKEKSYARCKCGSKQLREIERIKDTVIRMKLEDPSETSEYSHRTSSCYGQAKNLLADHLMRSNINVGDRVIVTGRLVENPTVKGTAISTFFMETDWIERDTQKEIDETISKELIEEFITTTRDNVAFLTKLKKSIAPNIFMYEDCKLALAIQELSGINLKTRVWDNPQVKKQYVHIILAGDPSSGKSQLAKFMMKVAPKIYFASGDQATISGLIGAVTQDSAMGGEWTLSAGALSMANGGTIAIDELNKLDAKEISKLNQVLTDYSVPIDKAKINTTVYTEVKLLGIMNPESDSWKHDEMNRQKILQLNLKKAFTTRMTLIFRFYEDDLSSSEDVELALRRQQGMIDDENRDVFSVEWLKKFFVYAKRKDVIFDTDELVKRKMNFYNNIFKPRIKEFITDVEKEQGNYSRDEIPSKMRLLADNYEALVSGFARTQVTKEDFCRPLPHHFDLVDYYLERHYLEIFFKKDQTIWNSAGININIHQTIKKVMVENLLRFIGSQNADIGVSYEQIWAKWISLGGTTDEDEFNRNVLEKLRNSGDIFEPKPAYFKILGSPVYSKPKENVEERMFPSAQPTPKPEPIVQPENVEIQQENVEDNDTGDDNDDKVMF